MASLKWFISQDLYMIISKIFHNSITQSFGFEGNEMASFYLSDNEWNQGEEISLFDLGDIGETNRLMSDVLMDMEDL